MQCEWGKHGWANTLENQINLVIHGGLEGKGSLEAQGGFRLILGNVILILWSLLGHFMVIVWALFRSFLRKAGGGGGVGGPGPRSFYFSSM